MMTAEQFCGVKSFERIAGLFLATVMLAGSLTGKLACISLYSVASCQRVRQNSVSLARWEVVQSGSYENEIVGRPTNSNATKRYEVLDHLLIERCTV